VTRNSHFVSVLLHRILHTDLTKFWRIIMQYFQLRTLQSLCLVFHNAHVLRPFVLYGTKPPISHNLFVQSDPKVTKLINPLLEKISALC
jgi:hypothetical protein